MRTTLDCLPCLLRQALDAARLAQAAVEVQRDVLHCVARTLPSLRIDATPVELGREVHRIVRETLGVDDPYRSAKREDNERVLALLPRLREIIAQSDDRLLTSLKLAAAGNTIDFGAGHAMDIEHAIEHALDDGVRLDEYHRFAGQLDRVEDVLVLGDNAGEIVFDRLVVEELVDRGKRVTFAVRARPILNDATIEDARFAGIDELADVISSGSDGPGTARSLCEPGFLRRLEHAGLILSKGQGNYEGLSEEDAALFFLLKVKCSLVARDLGEDVGEIVLRSSRGKREDC